MPAQEPAKKSLSAFDATLLVMGGIIGVGIFFTPSLIARHAFEPWAFLTMWALGGAIALCAAFTFAELAGTFPESGGWFVFLRESFGPFPAFLFAWVVLFVISSGSMAAVMTFCNGMLHEALPELVPEGSRLPAVLVVLVLTGITMCGVKRAALLQNASMILKLVVLFGLIVAGYLFFSAEDAAAFVSPGGAADAARATLERPPLWRGMFAALLPVFFTYGGWQMICYVASEVDDPVRSVPRAILFGVLGVVVVYLVANAAFLHVLGLEGIAADSGFASRLAAVTLGATGARILSLGMAISAIGILAVNIITTPWLYVAMANEGLFFRGFARLHPTTGAPLRALSVQALLILVYVFASDLEYLVESAVFVEWIFHGLVAWGLVRLRRLRPELPRPFRSLAYPLAPLVYLVTAVAIVGTTLLDDSDVKWTGLAILLVGALVYRPWRAFLARRA